MSAICSEICALGLIVSYQLDLRPHDGSCSAVAAPLELEENTIACCFVLHSGQRGLESSTWVLNWASQLGPNWSPTGPQLGFSTWSQLVVNWSSIGPQLVLNWSSIGPQLVLNWPSTGPQLVLNLVLN